jgi:hypothetical protein
VDSANSDQFVSEPITPVDASFSTAAMVTGAPGLPMKFTWRKKEYSVTEVLKTWTSTGSCTHGSAEQYVRKHWYRIRTDDGSEMQIYFDRKPRPGQNKKRWWLSTIARK